MTDKITFTSKGKQHEMPIYGSRSGGQPVVKAQHCPNCETTKQELSDAVTALLDRFLGDSLSQGVINGHLHQFIIPAPKPDPLVEVLKDFGGFMPDADDFRAALEARGLEIREKGQ